MRVLLLFLFIINISVFSNDVCDNNKTLDCITPLKKITTSLLSEKCGHLKSFNNGTRIGLFLITDKGKNIYKINSSDTSSSSYLNSFKDNAICIKGNFQNTNVSVTSNQNIRSFKDEICGSIERSPNGSFTLHTSWGIRYKLNSKDEKTKYYLASLMGRGLCVNANFSKDEVQINSRRDLKDLKGEQCGTLLKTEFSYILSVAGISNYKLDPQDGASSNVLSTYANKDLCIKSDKWSSNKYPDGIPIVSAAQLKKEVGIQCGEVHKTDKGALKFSHIGSDISLGRELSPEDGATTNALNNTKSSEVCINANWSSDPVSITSISKIYF